MTADASTQTALSLVEEIGAAPTAEAIQAAIKETEVDYFGDCRLSWEQTDAVLLLANAARALLPARAHIDQVTRERDEALAACKAAFDSVGRFPGSVHDRAMAKIERVLEGRTVCYTDPDLEVAQATITAQAADIARLKEACAYEADLFTQADADRKAAEATVERLKAELAGKDAEIAVLSRAFRWFAKYPEFKPNPEMMEVWLADIAAARALAKESRDD